MAETIILSDVSELSRKAATMAAQQLNKALRAHGTATWVLAGGTAPMGAYRILAKDFQEAVDWSRVKVLIGDERCVPLGHPDSNWAQISHTFLNVVPISDSNKLRPQHDLPAEAAAADYAAGLADFVQNEDGVPLFDHVWLGVGEDGHTLSLFPGHPALFRTGALVIPVHDSPKPPPDRISLTLQALSNVKSCIIMASGRNKADIIGRVMRDDSGLPIVQTAKTIEAGGGEVTWLLDTEAASQLKP